MSSQTTNDEQKGGPVRRCRPGYCSFCRRHYRDVGPLVEGPDSVFICYKCIESCKNIIEDESRRLGKPLPPSAKAVDQKGTDARGA
jgi:ATP-dependent Clp protease ATP-binding subunit ClpX